MYWRSLRVFKKHKVTLAEVINDDNFKISKDKMLFWMDEAIKYVKKNGVCEDMGTGCWYNTSTEEKTFIATYWSDEDLDFVMYHGINDEHVSVLIEKAKSYDYTWSCQIMKYPLWYLDQLDELATMENFYDEYGLTDAGEKHRRDLIIKINGEFSGNVRQRNM